MRPLAIGTILILLLGGWFGYSAYDNFEKGRAQRSINEEQRRHLLPLQEQIAQIREVDPWPLRYSEDMLSDFVTRTIEAGEALGAGVRVESRQQRGRSGSISFRPLQAGVEVAELSVQIAIEGRSAPALMGFIEEELASMPVKVSALRVNFMGEDISLVVETDVYGRTIQ